MMPSERSGNNRRSGLVDITALGGVERGGVDQVVLMIPGCRGGVCLHDAVRRTAERTQVNAVLHVVLLQFG